MTTPSYTPEPVEIPSMYAKAIVAIFMAALAVVLTALSDDVITLAEWVGVALAIVSAVGVYLLPNLPHGVQQYSKMLIAILFAALQALAPLVLEGTITRTGYILIALAVLNAVGVGIVPNTGAARGRHVAGGAELTIR